MSERKPKFRKGQVVAVIRTKPDVTIYFGKIRVVSAGSGGYYLYNVDGVAMAENDLRALTRRERSKP